MGQQLRRAAEVRDVVTPERQDGCAAGGETAGVGIAAGSPAFRGCVVRVSETGHRAPQVQTIRSPAHGSARNFSAAQDQLLTFRPNYANLPECKYVILT